ncbi:MAG: translation initiation factor IF-2 [Lactobacillales bacterium]|jgi:translation initiation factor IF-2|nr:translation initiation factor IF-2 [Lactobacillales bacterium]
MTEVKKPLTLSGKTLGLKTLSVGNRVRQNVGAGKTNVVQVEVRKKRVITPDNPSGMLSEEASQKLKLIQEAQRVAEQHKKMEEERRIREENDRLEREKRQQQEMPADVPVIADVSDKKKHSEAKTFTNETPAPRKKEGGDADDWQAKKTSHFEEKRAGKINLNVFKNIAAGGDEDDIEGEGVRRPRRSLASIRRAREKERLKHLESLKTPEKITREVIIPETITVQELANRMSEKGATVVKVLMKLGMMVTINQTIDADTAELVVDELGHKARRVAESDVEDILKTESDNPSHLITRPPVVTVMGHVDHGKTSLLDALRSTNVAAGESGGITQHIGAYQVALPSGQKVTFIDTPGHEAFTAMRARGAKVTDIVVLVVAANDSVMPQTIEAIHHAKAAGVPIVVAINKIDAPGANPQKVRMDLLNHEIVVESMGGDVQDVEVSAKLRQNMDKLIEAILLQAEVLDLKADPDRTAEGVVVEARMDKGRGSVATVLVQKGTLHVGDIFVSGQEWGRVRSLFNDQGKRVDEALPAQPLEVIGLQGTPKAGDDFIVVDSENRAREVSGYRQRKARELLNVKTMSGAEHLLAKIKAGEIKELPVLIKGDVQGSVEALNGILSKIANNEVKIHILHSGVGAINESDITLARASKAIVIGFNVRANPTAREMAKRDGVDIRYYSIVYDVADDMKKALEGLLAPEYREKILGYAEVRQVISISKVGKIAGCMVTEGVVKRGAKVRLLRDNVVIHEGTLSQLKRFKDDVKEVKEGFECGMSFEKYDDVKVGDTIECFEMEEIAVKLNI